MKILFDQGTPAPLRHELVGHLVSTAMEKSWAELSNGELLRAAEDVFDVLITTDQNMQYQQSLKEKHISVLMLTTTSWPRIKKHARVVADALARIQPGTFTVVTIPD